MSSALSETQQRYSQIGIETLAIAFGCKKFHQQICEQYIVSDHKPLEPIFKKGIHEILGRLQNVFLKLQKYDLDIKPGKTMFLSDFLYSLY